MAAFAQERWGWAVAGIWLVFLVYPVLETFQATEMPLTVLGLNPAVELLSAFITRNALMGFFLVFLILALFMRFRLAFWAGVGIPIAFLGTMWLMPTLDVSINMLSLFAFLLVLGRTFMARKFTHEQAVSAIVVSYYWHFVDVVWIGLFATIYLIR